MAHEVVHVSEYLNPVYLAYKSGGNDHTAFAKKRSDFIAMFSELNQDLNLGLKEAEIELLSFVGAEKTKEFEKYINDRVIASKGASSKADEIKKYNAERDELLGRKIDPSKIEEEEQTPASAPAQQSDNKKE